jgi:hypothetical protein
VAALLYKLSSEGYSYNLIHSFNEERSGGNKIIKGINERDNWIKDEDNKKNSAELLLAFLPVYNS